MALKDPGVSLAVDSCLVDQTVLWSKAAPAAVMARSFPVDSVSFTTCCGVCELRAARSQ